MIDFPNSPTNGQVVTLNSTNYTWNSAKGAWQTSNALDSSAITQALGYTPYNATNPNNYISEIPANLYISNLYKTGGSGSITIPTNNSISGIDAGSIRAPGMVINHAYTRSDNKVSYSIPTAGSTGNFITDLNVTITPKYSTSKMLITYCIGFECVNDTIFRLFRNVGGVDTEIGRNANDGNYWAGAFHPGYDADNASTPRTNTYFYLDTAGTTSAITYKLMIQSAGTGATTFWLNRPLNSAGAANYEVGISQVIVQEIAQ